LALTEALALSALPPTGFVRSYVEYAYQLTDAPLSYHLATGLSVLASCLDSELHMYFAGNRLYAPIWVLLLGRSGADRKTTAIGIGQDIMRAVEETLIGAAPGSPEGLASSLSQYPKQTLVYTEFGAFLQKSSNESGQFASIRSLLTQFYDCDTTAFRLAQTVKRVSNPRLSILAACTPQHLEDYTGPTDYHGGFMSRFALLYAQRERTLINPPMPDESVKEHLIETLKAIRTRKAGKCLGFTSLASQMLNDWSAATKERYGKDAPEWTRGAIARGPTLARKVALIYAADGGSALEAPEFHITEHDLRPALAFAEMHLISACEATRRLTQSRYGRERKNVMDVLEKQDEPVPLQVLLRGVMPRMEKRRALQVLDSMKAEGAIRGYLTSIGEEEVYGVTGGPAPEETVQDFLNRPVH
jgi:hypothetical protein